MFSLNLFKTIFFSPFTFIYRVVITLFPWNIYDKNISTALDFSAYFDVILLCAEGYNIFKETLRFFEIALKGLPPS